MVKRTTPKFNIKQVDAVLEDDEITSFLSEHEGNLAVDENALDEALQGQVFSFYEVSKRLSLQISRRDAAKQHLQTVESRVDRRIRKRIAEGTDKADKRLTEKGVESERNTHVDVVEARDLLLRLNHGVGVLTALKDAFQQRSYVLKELAQLFIANYYGDASLGASDRQVTEHKANIARRQMSEERKRRAHRSN